MLIKELMTPSPACCAPSDPLDKVAKLMAEHNCGEIPVCDGTKLIGVITDRDITTRVVATGKTPVAMKARDVMTRNPVTILETAKLDEALDLMEEELVRRLPVVNGDGRIVGIVSQADLVAKSPTMKVARAMKNVARKTRPRPAL